MKAIRKCFTVVLAVGFTRLQVVEWSVDALFTVEVRTGCGLGAPFDPKGIRYVKLAPGILDHRAPGGSAGL